MYNVSYEYVVWACNLFTNISWHQLTDYSFNILTLRILFGFQFDYLIFIISYPKQLLQLNMCDQFLKHYLVSCYLSELFKRMTYGALHLCTFPVFSLSSVNFLDLVRNSLLKNNYNTCHHRTK